MATSPDYRGAHNYRKCSQQLVITPGQRKAVNARPPETKSDRTVHSTLAQTKDIHLTSLLRSSSTIEVGLISKSEADQCKLESGEFSH